MDIRQSDVVCIWLLLTHMLHTGFGWKVLRLCLYLKVIRMLYNKIHTDEQINVSRGTVEKIESKNEYCWRYSSPRQPI